MSNLKYLSIIGAILLAFYFLNLSIEDKLATALFVADLVASITPLIGVAMVLFLFYLMALAFIHSNTGRSEDRRSNVERYVEYPSESSGTINVVVRKEVSESDQCHYENFEHPYPNPVYGRRKPESRDISEYLYSGSSAGRSSARSSWVSNPICGRRDRFKGTLY